MIILWGFRPFERVMTGFAGTCRFCGQPGTQQVLERGTKFTLFFIPLFGFGRRYVVRCLHCGNEDPIEKDRAQQLAAGATR